MGTYLPDQGPAIQESMHQRPFSCQNRLGFASSIQGGTIPDRAGRWMLAPAYGTGTVGEREGAFYPTGRLGQQFKADATHADQACFTALSGKEADL